MQVAHAQILTRKLTNFADLCTCVRYSIAGNRPTSSFWQKQNTKFTGRGKSAFCIKGAVNPASFPSDFLSTSSSFSSSFIQAAGAHNRPTQEGYLCRAPA